MKENKSIQYVLTNHKDVELVLMQFNPDDGFYNYINKIEYSDIFGKVNMLGSAFNALNDITDERRKLFDTAEAIAFVDKDYSKYCDTIYQAKKYAELEGALVLINSFVCSIENQEEVWKDFRIEVREADLEERYKYKETKPKNVKSMTVNQLAEYLEKNCDPNNYVWLISPEHPQREVYSIYEENGYVCLDPSAKWAGNTTAAQTFHKLKTFDENMEVKCKSYEFTAEQKSVVRPIKAIQHKHWGTVIFS